MDQQQSSEWSHARDNVRYAPMQLVLTLVNNNRYPSTNAQGCYIRVHVVVNMWYQSDHVSSGVYYHVARQRSSSPKFEITMAHILQLLLHWVRRNRIQFAQRAQRNIFRFVYGLASLLELQQSVSCLRTKTKILNQYGG